MVIRRIEGKSSIFDCVSVSSYYNSGSSVRNGTCSVGGNSDYIVGSSG